ELNPEGPSSVDIQDSVLNNSGQVGSGWDITPLIDLDAGNRPRPSQDNRMAKILCVDDEPNIVTLKAAILEAAGHQVTSSTSALDAIEKLEHNTYDAVVTDWRLGDTSGRAIVQG